MRGVWVATVLNLDYPAFPTISSEELSSQADQILDNAASYGFNTIFLQVRPCSDAFYDSKFYPWSAYLTGKQDTAPDSGFDPLAYWIQGAHNRGMESHAWINPFRVARSTDEWEHLSENSPAILHPEWVIEYNDEYYFDPALPEVRQLIIDVAVEIAEHYDIDGIHMDDYFYPGSDFNDTDSFGLYGRSFSDIGEWRRNNVNILVGWLSIALHKLKPNIEFGISPGGIWASSSLEPDGSNTSSTNSSYRNQYADSRLWVKAGWVDYIAPQIY